MELKPIAVSLPEHIRTASATNGGASRPLPPDWESHVYQLDRRAALDLGFTVGSVTATANTRLLVMDTVRAETIQVGPRTQRWGCGYRLQIEISDIATTGRLTLPWIAASVELGQTEASISLHVKGYPKNDLWDVIPDPEPLTVESYKHYLEAASNIKDKFNELGDAAISVLLASDDPKSEIGVGGITDVELAESSAIVWGLKSIDREWILAEALDEFPSPREQSLVEVVEGVYRRIRGDERFNSDERINDSEKAAAHSQLAIAGLS
jgi:hypothetical protein